MATVIRVKRALIEEPEDVLIINRKKRKTDEINNEEELTIFKKTATLNNLDNNISKHIKNSMKCKIEENYKGHISDVHNKIKAENEVAQRNSRYTVVNLYRSIEEPSTAEDDFTIIDVATDNNAETDAFVYDLYCSDSNNLGEIKLNELISICPLSNEIYDGNYENDASDDDSDSNDENNWRNDYPDESDHESITEDDMIDAMNRVDINQENEFSTDDDESYIYGDSREYSNSVDRSGKLYSRFKANFNKNNPSSDSFDEESD